MCHYPTRSSGHRPREKESVVKCSEVSIVGNCFGLWVILRICPALFPNACWIGTSVGSGALTELLPLCIPFNTPLWSTTTSQVTHETLCTLLRTPAESCCRPLKPWGKMSTWSTTSLNRKRACCQKDGKHITVLLHKPAVNKHGSYNFWELGLY